MTYVIKPDAPVLVLRTAGADMISEHGFTWPELGPVAAPDWQPTAECGRGLHGLLWGAGDGSLLDWSSDAEWIVVEVGEYVDLNGKVKFPRGNVVFCGSREAATAYIAERAPAGTNVVGGAAAAGDDGIATSGHRGTAAAGDYGTAAAGDYGTAAAGDYGTAACS